MSGATRIGLGLLATMLLVSFSAQAAKMTGKVTDESGTPLKNVIVRVEPVEGGRAAVEVKTKKKGTYFFAMLRRGAYRLEVEAEGMRVAEVDLEIKNADNRTTLDKAGIVEPGKPLPEFSIADTDTISFDIVLAPTMAGGGEFGTGVALLASGEIVKLIQDGKYDKARTEIDNVVQHAPDDPKGHYMLAYLELEQANLDESLAAVDRCMELDPGFAGARLLKAAILEQQGDAEAAMEMYKLEAAATDTPELKLNAWVRYAILAKQQGMTQEALDALHMIIEVDPSNSAAYAQLIEMYMAQGKVDELDELLEQAPPDIRQDPNVHFNVAAALYNEGHPEQAVASLEKVLEYDPQYVDAYRLMGYCQVGTNDLDGAIESLTRYLELAPDAPDAGQVQSLLAGLEKQRG